MTVALDTSVAVPLLLANHEHHDEVVAWLAGRPVALAGHAVVETYAVLTRLPGTMRSSPADAARVLEARFLPPLQVGADRLANLPGALAAAGVAGAATYDALVGCAAVDNDVVLATRDARALPTYAAVGARVEVVRSGNR